jgi:ribosome-associated protein
MIDITPSIALDESELQESFIRASGPGGQNVNKVATAVQLRFDIRGSPNLPEAVRARAEKLAGRRLTQDRNRADARAQRVALLQQAAIAPIRRRPTRPTKASKTRRLEAKSHRGAIKRGRSGQTEQ